MFQLCHCCAAHDILHYTETFVCNIDGLVQERRNSIANALELCLSCTNPSRCQSLKIYVPLLPNRKTNHWIEVALPQLQVTLTVKSHVSKNVWTLHIFKPPLWWLCIFSNFPFDNLNSCCLRKFLIAQGNWAYGFVTSMRSSDAI